MAGDPARVHNRDMKESQAALPTPDDAAKGRKSTRISELEAQIDERDETIRLLNEALSRALGELDLPRAA
jgi:hypothetical protein